MRNLKLVIEYDGTGYSGWQYQPDKPTIQGVLKKAISKVEDVSLDSIKLVGASRTDAGVHAIGQVANFLSNRELSADRFRKAINSLLPEDIVVKSVEEVPLSFNARRNAKGKKYKYVILNRDYPSALERNRVYYLPFALDIELVRKAIPMFIGKKDFASFQSSGGEVKTTVREIFQFSLDVEGDYLIFTITGNGFLKQMVRNIIGTLVFVGLKKFSLDDIPLIFKARDRRMAGPTAPPYGLYLVEIFY